MRLNIFWRAILAQSALIGLALILSLYALTQFSWLTQLGSSIVSVDTPCLKEEKALLKAFLSQIRHGEKYLALHDPAFHNAFDVAGQEFAETLQDVCGVVDLPREQELTAQIRELHSRYVAELDQAGRAEGSRIQLKTEISEGIIDRIGELIRLREQAIADKTAAAHNRAASAGTVMGWLTLGGIGAALMLATLHARGVSLPLRKLAGEMRRVGKGEFTRSVTLHSSQEVYALAQTFNRMTEELSQLDKLKSDFTAHVSHELRTPLTAIREGTALLLEEIPGPLTPSQREILEVVRSHSERLCRSISSILDLSKMEAEMMEYGFTACDLRVLIERSMGTVNLIARKRRIHIESIAGSPGSLPLLLLDENRIGQVLDNLLSNALKFTPEGGRITVSTSVFENGEEMGSEVRVTVADTGGGIPEGEIEKIFGRFYQGSHNRKNSGQGTGLGLAIARHIIQAHGGRIWAESAPGRGAAFTFSLPVVSPADH